MSFLLRVTRTLRERSQLARYGFPHPRYLGSTGNLNTRNSTGVDDLSSGNISRLELTHIHDTDERDRPTIF